MHDATLEDSFGVELDALRQLFTPAYVEARLDRLTNIFRYADARWLEYTELIPGRRVGLLLVAEAPPWSPEGVPQYVLHPASRPRTLMKALRSAFHLPPVGKMGSGAALHRLAELGVLVVDSIPFALDYTGKRAGHAYQELVGLTVRSYLPRSMGRTTRTVRSCARCLDLIAPLSTEQARRLGV